MSFSAHQDADVIVVGAGPGGSATAHYLAQLGRSVIFLEKSTFPRDKVCGDGLTPYAVRELVRMGVPMPAHEGWMRNKGLRVVGGGHEIYLPWPESESFPSYGMAKARTSFDETLALHAQASGADPALGDFPSAIDGELKISPMFLCEFGTGKPHRARVPGVWHISQTGAYGPLNDGDMLAGAGDLAGRTLMCVATTTNYLPSPVNAVYLVDITGPWR